MGFDIECIIDIHTYPGEYFCPVCRTLVYPSEAFQAQCTHLYCKPCLTHIANGTRACPYDGYLVTEADSKPLMNSDKSLAENIGKVKVHCLFFRSGCTWEGALSECTSHCSACSFGNSPVICNRCGIQIVHRQVHDHAQTCPGMYGGQQAVGGVTSATTRSSTATSSVTAEANQTVSQPGAPSQVLTTQNITAAPVPGQNTVHQVNSNSQAPAAAPVNVPTPDQWYQQQQYQQYYQQYAGYYQQQPNQQQYYQLHQQPFQQYQQPPAQVQGQLQSQVQPQSVPQPHLQPQAQPHQQPQQQPHSLPLSVPQAPQQPHLQPQAQAQSQQQPQSQPQVQVPPQPQVQGHAPVQALAPNYQVNPQQPPHPTLRPQTQSLPPPPHSNSSQPQYPQGVGMRPPSQPPQVPQYQQHHVQPHHQASQFHVQPQMQLQPQSQAQPQPQLGPSNLPYVQGQPQVQPYPTPSPAPVFPPQGNQSTGPTALPQASHLPGPPVSGHHSYQQPNSAPKMQPGSSQQHPLQPFPVNVSVHPSQVHSHTQVPQQPGVMRPSPQVSLPPQQPPTMLPLQNQTPLIPPQQHHQFPPHAQQHTHSLQNRPVMQPVPHAVPQQYAQQQHFPAPLQGQLHQQAIQPLQRPPGPPQLQQSQNYVGRPIMTNQGIQQQNHPFSTETASLAQSMPAHVSSTQMSANQTFAKSTVMEHKETVQETRSPSRGLSEKVVEGEIKKEKAVTGHTETVVNEADNTKDVRNESSIKQEEDIVHGSLEQAPGGKSFETVTVVNEVFKKDGSSLADSDSLKQVNPENQKLSMAVGPPYGSHDKSSQTAISDPGLEGHLSQQVQGHPSSVPGPEGAGILPHPGQSLNSDEGRAHGYYGHPKGFEPQSTSHGPAPPTQAYSHGIIGRTLPHEGPMSRDHLSGAANTSGNGEGAGAKTNAVEPSSFRSNGGTASQDGKQTVMPREPFNPLPGEPTRPLDQAPRFLDKVPLGPINETESKMNPSAFGPHPRFLPPTDYFGGRGNVDIFGAAPEYSQHHMKHFPHRSPGREYFGLSPRRFGDPTAFPRGPPPAFDDVAPAEAHRFSEGSRSFNLSSGRGGNPLHDAKFPPFSGHLDPRFGELRPPGSDEAFGPDGPGHLARGKFSGPGYFPGNFGMAESAGPGAFPGHGRAREMGGTANYAHRPFNEPVRGDRFAQFNEPTMHNYPIPGNPNAGTFSSGMDSFESWKRKPVSTGWCRICRVDCESVEGLELHSQSRDHQKMAMDMVKSIKLQNKKQRTGGPLVHDGGSRNWKAGIVGHGSNA